MRQTSRNHQENDIIEASLIPEFSVSFVDPMHSLVPVISFTGNYFIKSLACECTKSSGKSHCKVCKDFKDKIVKRSDRAKQKSLSDQKAIQLTSEQDMEELKTKLKLANQDLRRAKAVPENVQAFLASEEKHQNFTWLKHSLEY